MRVGEKSEWDWRRIEVSYKFGEVGRTTMTGKATTIESRMPLEDGSRGTGQPSRAPPDGDRVERIPELDGSKPHFFAICLRNNTCVWRFDTAMGS